MTLHERFAYGRVSVAAARLQGMSTDDEKRARRLAKRREARLKEEKRMRAGKFGFHPDILGAAGPMPRVTKSAHTDDR